MRIYAVVDNTLSSRGIGLIPFRQCDSRALLIQHVSPSVKTVIAYGDNIIGLEDIAVTDIPEAVVRLH